MKLISKSLIISIIFTSNNILYTLTNLQGQVIYWISAGTYKQKGTKKLTSTTSILTTKLIIERLGHFNCKFLHIKLKGFKKNKKTILKYFKISTLNILSVCDDTALPHNGCKRKKIRRL